MSDETLVDVHYVVVVAALELGARPLEERHLQQPENPDADEHAHAAVQHNGRAIPQARVILLLRG